jgi:rubrerythrin
MEGIQKLKCTSCGVSFMSENNVAICPSCIEGQGHGDTGCGCGHSH